MKKLVAMSLAAALGGYLVGCAGEPAPSGPSGTPPTSHSGTPPAHTPAGDAGKAADPAAPAGDASKTADPAAPAGDAAAPAGEAPK
jgi:hypothetical protein